MHVLHITQSLDPSWGGIARVLPELATRLTSVDVNSTVACLHGDRFGTAPSFDGFEVRSFAAKPRSPLGRSPEFDAAIDALVRTADVVHIHGLWAGQNQTAGAAAHRAGKPLVVTPHSMMMPWAWNRSAWKKRLVGWWFEHRNLRRAAALHALAEGEAASMRALGFNSNITVIPNGIEPRDFENLPSADELETRFAETRGKKWLLILGRIAEQKGIVPAFKALAEVLPEYPDWHLIVAGPDPFELIPRLRAIAGAAESQITFTGMLERRDVMACLARSSLLVQPSFSEGLSMSILEAMAAGLPALVAPGCNMPEIAASDAGVDVQANARSIAAGLRSLLSMPEENWTRLSENARRLACERFAWSALMPCYRALYDSCLA